jgi:hypothetical protein
VESPKSLGVTVWFVAGIDEWPLESGFESDDFFEEFGPGADLKSGVVPTCFVGLGANFAGAAKDHTTDEVRQKSPYEIIEWHGSVHEIVLVGAVGISLAVGIVLIETKCEGWIKGGVTGL